MSDTYEDFIDAVWAYESSIDPARRDYYDDNWNTPVTDYPEVEYPGRVVRDPATGEPVQKKNLTIEEYFTAIGIVELYDSRDPDIPWKRIQAAVTNYLGFIGFQFQESDLQALGYYKYATKEVDGTVYPSHYVDVPVANWKNNVTAFLDKDPKEVDTPTWVTDTVMFEDANFLGKHGITSKSTFEDPDKQIFVIQDHFENKFQGITTGLQARDKHLKDYLGTVLNWDGLQPKVSPPPQGRSNEVTITLSGLLAGAHLRGAGGVVALLLDHQNPQDESGTYILQYVQDYANYKTPFTPTA